MKTFEQIDLQVEILSKLSLIVSKLTHPDIVSFHVAHLHISW